MRRVQNALALRFRNTAKAEACYGAPKPVRSKDVPPECRTPLIHIHNPFDALPSGNKWLLEFLKQGVRRLLHQRIDRSETQDAFKVVVREKPDGATERRDVARTPLWDLPQPRFHRLAQYLSRDRSLKRLRCA